MKCAYEICPTFKIEVEERPLYDAVFRWCLGMPGTLDPRKGLWLYGNNGTGKSTLLQIVKRFCRDVQGRDANGNQRGTFRISNAVEVCGHYAGGGTDRIQTYIDSNKQAFDELGSESIPSAYFGNTLNVMQYILQLRYEKRQWSVTHITTNLSIEQISDVYGVRIYDRCKEMFNFVPMTGASKRR